MTDAINMAIQLINGVGFPIAACIFMAIFILKDKKAHANSYKQNMEQTALLYTQLKEAVENNTKMIEKLIERMGE